MSSLFGEKHMKVGWSVVDANLHMRTLPLHTFHMQRLLHALNLTPYTQLRDDIRGSASSLYATVTVQFLQLCQ